ncbi:MAG TPA: S41 family peptidase, partial [Deinococcales bacterium]|nr:S41 family peptidase [Deinococcales bacterium]
QPDLDKACAGQVDSCPYTAATPVIKAMVAELNDGHSYYLTPEQRADADRSQSGQGPAKPKIGVTLGDVTGSHDILVTDVIAGAPASKAGLQRGDRLVALNGKPSGDYDTAVDFRQALIDAVGTGNPVTIKVARGTNPAKDVVVTGEMLATPALPSLTFLPGNVADLRIPNFQAVGLVAQTVHNLVNQAVARNVTGMVLDLRDNSGGAVVEMLAATGAFLPSVGFAYQARDGSSVNQWRGDQIVQGEGAGVYRIQKPALYTGPLDVLINSHSGSAPEYMAQFLQDAHRATIIGEPSAGVANTVVRRFGLLDGSALAITIAKSVRLDGTPLPERVTPDVAVTDDLDTLATTGRDVMLDAGLKAITTPPASASTVPATQPGAPAAP